MWLSRNCHPKYPPSPHPCVSFTYQPFWLSEPFCRPKSRGLINPSNERDKRGDSDCRPAWRVSVTTGQTFRIIRGYEPHGRHLNPGWRPLKRSDTGGTYRMREKKRKSERKRREIRVDNWISPGSCLPRGSPALSSKGRWNEKWNAAHAQNREAGERERKIKCVCVRARACEREREREKKSRKRGKKESRRCHRGNPIGVWTVG